MNDVVVGSVLGGSVVVYGAGMAIQLKGKPSEDIRYALQERLKIARQKKSAKGICKFSELSKRRLKRLLSSFDYEDLQRQGYCCYFCTGTYQKDLYLQFLNLRDVKKHIKLIADRFRLYFSDHGFFVWKLEFHKSGVPHLHFLFFLRLSYTEFLQVFQKLWLSTFRTLVKGRVDHFDERLLRMSKAATNTSYVPLSLSHIIAVYINKEVGKAFQVQGIDEWTGRFWGVVCRDNAKKFISVAVFDVSVKEFFLLRRLLVRYARAVLRLRYSVHLSYSGLSLFSSYRFFYDFFRYFESIRESEKK